MALSQLKTSAGDTSQSIIDGALSVMAENGLQQLTTKRVSVRAEVSTAAIHYFFKTKDRLIYESFAHVIRQMRINLLNARRGEPDAIIRIRKTMDVFFCQDDTTVAAIKIWPQFWVQAGTDKPTARLFQIYNERMISNFTYDLMDAGMTRKEARANALRLNAVHRGFWIEIYLGNRLTVSEAKQNYNSMIDNFSKIIHGKNA